MPPALSNLLDDLIVPCNARDRASIAATLRRFGMRALRFARASDVRIVALGADETYAARSPAIRRLGVGLDSWPQPPAGVFVVAERTVYARSVSRMTIAHEFGHALDCALGAGVYRSCVDPCIRRAFEAATAFVTPYAASSIDEYFAECMRAYVDANDACSTWPPATPQRLAALDPAMYAYISGLFSTVF